MTKITSTIWTIKPHTEAKHAILRKYLDDGKQKPFYVDFIVKMKDGRTALFDTHGLHLSDFGPKSDGLRNYIQDENKKGKKLFGGIATNTDQKKYSRRWVYFDKPGKELMDKRFDNWRDLEL